MIKNRLFISIFVLRTICFCARQKGAIVDANVTKRTTLLVVDQVGTMNNKEKTCMQKKIPILSLREFTKKYL